MAEVRYDIIADTHGYLSPELLAALEGADVIVHAGDCCSETDYWRLAKIAPIYMCKGNNDAFYKYGTGVERMVSFYRTGLRWQINHYRERLDTKVADVCVCGHTHRARLERTPSGVIVMNPGSPTYPRGGGPTMGRIVCVEGIVLDAKIVDL